MAENEKKSVIEFHGKKILNESGLSCADIVKEHNGRLQYRTTYAFFNENDGNAKIETAAMIALSLKVSLNDLYTPKGKPWLNQSPLLQCVDTKERDDELKIILKHLPDDVRQQLMLDLYESGHIELSEKCNSYFSGASKAVPEAKGEQDDG